MEYRRLGNSGLKVSAIGLGAMTFGSRFYNIAKVGQEEATKMIAQALERGVNFFDTADVYSFGESETILGKALQAVGVRREEVVIATKVRSPMSKAASRGSGDVNNVGLSRKHIFEACAASLKRLGTDYIDLYQVHGWDIASPLDEVLDALHALVQQGKVLYLGCSNWSARHLAYALALQRAHRLSPFTALQAYYSLVGRDLEHELLPLCREEGLGLLPWSPLSGGYLTGKFRKGEPSPKEARRSQFAFPPIDEELGEAALSVLTKLAQKKGVPPAQVAIRWLLSRPAVSSVLIGARTMDQLKVNLSAIEVELSAEETATLSEATAPPPLYPEWMIARQNEGRS